MIAVLPVYAAGFFLPSLPENQGGEPVKVKSQLMDDVALGRALMRISHEILEKNKGTEGLVILGIRRRGKSKSTTGH